MLKVEGKGGISATIVADSISEAGKRITTFELEYPRFVHSEFMTHRLFSRNAASSRAIPVNKMIEHVEENTAMPIHWGANQKGMQASSECNSIIGECSREQLWERAASVAADIADAFATAGYHKQIVNRLLEPYQFIKVVCTATEYDNFFWLRKHPDAQPEIAELARVMWEARELSHPLLLKPGMWHLPYVDRSNLGYTIPVGGDYENGRVNLSVEDALKVSASCCAQVSYRLADNSLEKAKKIYDMLVESKPVHSSPFEHQACPMETNNWRIDEGAWEEGITHIDREGFMWSGNFKGWVQHRQLIPENACWNYEN